MIPVTHVLYLSDVPGRPPLSGAERHVLLLLRELAANGVPVELVAMLWSGTDSGQIDLVLSKLAAAGVSVTRVQKREVVGAVAHKTAMLAAWFRLAMVLHSRRRAVVHLHLDLVVTPLVAWLSGCRSLVISVHNDEPSYGSWLWRVWWRVLRRLPLRLIAITQHVNDHVRDVGGWPADRITTVYYGVDQPAPPPLQRSDLGLPDDAWVVGFVGRLAPQKNLDVLLEVLARRPDIQGVIVGDGPLRDVLRAAAADNTMFLGEIPDAGRIMPAFDLFCLPSRWEGLGLVLVEAMLQGVPVVASNRGAIPEVLGGGEFGTVCQPTADSIGAGVDAIRRDPRAAAERAKRARRWAVARFSIPEMVESTRHVYALASRGRS